MAEIRKKYNLVLTNGGSLRGFLDENIKSIVFNDDLKNSFKRKRSIFNLTERY